MEISKMDISIMSALASAITALIVVFLTFLILKFAAKPKLRIRLKDRGRKTRFHANEKITLKFHIENVGHWYSAKPAAINVILWVNFEQAFEPIELRYGADLGKRTRAVRSSKQGNKWLRASEIHLFHQEAGEDIEVVVKMPEKKGRYRIWVTAHSNQGDCGVHKFWANIID
jgi:hypothetical protein